MISGGIRKMNNIINMDILLNDFNLYKDTFSKSLVTDIKDNVKVFSKEIDQLMKEHLELTLNNEYLSKISENFSRYQYVNVSKLFPAPLIEYIKNEVTSIVSKEKSRLDIKIEQTSNSPRKMSTVNYDSFIKLGQYVPALYSSIILRALLSAISRTAVIDCQYKNERITATHQQIAGDTHGWHWGDHAYALIFIIKAPSIDAGGMLQCIPHTTWDKESPNVNNYISQHPINTYYHSTGDVYFFKTDTNLHRTYPLERDSDRIILNLTLSNLDDLVKNLSHETQDRIYAQA
ncbi:MAG: ArpA protein [Coxiella sp. (in: Bacteria)]|nr:MAG: ArpA protein [Coxiella sp. (in: g-proteobacteria)]